MAAVSGKARKIHCEIMWRRRFRPDEDLTPLRQDYKAQRLADYIEAKVAEAPDLRPEQRESLARLLSGAS